MKSSHPTLALARLSAPSWPGRWLQLERFNAKTASGSPPAKDAGIRAERQRESIAATSSSTTCRCRSRRSRSDPERRTKPFKLGDLIEPFTPPPLAEIDKTAEWIDQPVQTAWR